MPKKNCLQLPSVDDECAACLEDPKIAEVTHPDRQISEEIAEAWSRVHISAWEFEGNIRPTN